MPDEANELHIVEVHDLLRVTLVSKVYHDKLTIVGDEALVHHQRIVNLD